MAGLTEQEIELIAQRIVADLGGRGGAGEKHKPGGPSMAGELGVFDSIDEAVRAAGAAFRQYDDMGLEKRNAVVAAMRNAMRTENLMRTGMCGTRPPQCGLDHVNTERRHFFEPISLPVTSRVRCDCLPCAQQCQSKTDFCTGTTFLQQEHLAVDLILRPVAPQRAGASRADAVHLPRHYLPPQLPASFMPRARKIDIAGHQFVNAD